jgi:hypothetical protein
MVNLATEKHMNIEKCTVTSLDPLSRIPLHAFVTCFSETPIVRQPTLRQCQGFEI